MSAPENHVMTTEWVEETQTLRFICPTCHRCMESDPEGIKLLYRGDQSARHSGGVLGTDVEAHPSSDEPPVLH